MTLRVPDTSFVQKLQNTLKPERFHALGPDNHPFSNIPHIDNFQGKIKKHEPTQGEPGQIAAYLHRQPGSDRSMEAPMRRI